MDFVKVLDNNPDVFRHLSNKFSKLSYVKVKATLQSDCQQWSSLFVDLGTHLFSLS